MLKQFHKKSVIILSHDHMSNFEDMVAMKKGGVTAKILLVMTDALPWADTLEEFNQTYYEYKGWGTRAVVELERILRICETNQDLIKIVYKSGDIIEAKQTGKVGVLLGFEGGKCLEGKLEMLSILYRLGVRHLGLTWAINNQISASQYDYMNGLTSFGKEVVNEMNRLGMIIDIQHLSFAAIQEVIKLSEKPVLHGHGGAKALSNDPVNLDDEMIKLLADKGGVLGVHFASHIIKDHAKITEIDDLMAQLKHIKNIGGIDVVALGPDYFYNDERFKRNTMFFYQDDKFTSGTDNYELTYVKGLENISKMEYLTESLIKNGFSYDEAEKILGKNMLRIIKECIDK
ncbi:MAG: membrane dipeptidase [Actinomycetota bacterium]|nr:membrane dipeptidase [Actinomycetota bacterium]